MTLMGVKTQITYYCACKACPGTSEVQHVMWSDVALIPALLAFTTVAKHVIQECMVTQDHHEYVCL